jgi:hypothetical protein
MINLSGIGDRFRPEGQAGYTAGAYSPSAIQIVRPEWREDKADLGCFIVPKESVTKLLARSLREFTRLEI